MFVLNIPCVLPNVDRDDELSDDSDIEEDNDFQEVEFEYPNSSFRLYPAEKEIKSSQPEKKNTFKKTSARRGKVDSNYCVLNPKITHVTDSRKSSHSDPRKKIVKLIEKESFDRDVKNSLELASQYIAIVFGLNMMRSLSKQKNSMLQKIASQPIESPVEHNTCAFFWNGVWQRKNRVNGGWDTVEYKTVRNFYKSLKTKKNRDTAIAFRKKVETERSHMVPYRGIRDKIKNSERTKELVTRLRLKQSKAEVYLGIMDADIMSLHSEAGIGLFSYYQYLYMSNDCGKDIMSTGYQLDETDPLLSFAVQLDLISRHFTAEIVKKGVYYPEPNLMIKLSHQHNTLEADFSTEDENYESPKESTIIIDKLLTVRKMNPQKGMLFDATVVPLTTAPPKRFEKPFMAAKSKNKKIVIWGERFIKQVSSISQSHYSELKWANNLINALQYRSSAWAKYKENKIQLNQQIIKEVIKSIVVRIFKMHDCRYIAQIKADDPSTGSYVQHFSDCLEHYEELQFDQYFQKNTGKRKSAHEIWPIIDGISCLTTACAVLDKLLVKKAQITSKHIIQAARNLHKQIAMALQQKLELREGFIAYNMLKDSVGDKNDVSEDAIFDQFKGIYKHIFTRDELNGQKRKLKQNIKEPKYGPYNTIPLHWLALLGDKTYIKWLIKEAADWTSYLQHDADNNIKPIHCAFMFCARNGFDRFLIDLVFDNDAALSPLSNGNNLLDLIFESFPVNEQLLIVKYLNNKYYFDLTTLIQNMHGRIPSEFTRFILEDQEYEILNIFSHGKSDEIIESVIQFVKDISVIEDTLWDFLEENLVDIKQVILDKHYGNIGEMIVELVEIGKATEYIENDDIKQLFESKDMETIIEIHNYFDHEVEEMVFDYIVNDYRDDTWWNLAKEIDYDCYDDIRSTLTTPEQIDLDIFSGEPHKFPEGFYESDRDPYEDEAYEEYMYQLSKSDLDSNYSNTPELSLQDFCERFNILDDVQPYKSQCSLHEALSFSLNSPITQEINFSRTDKYTRELLNDIAVKLNIAILYVEIHGEDYSSSIFSAHNRPATATIIQLGVDTFIGARIPANTEQTIFTKNEKGKHEEDSTTLEHQQPKPRKNKRKKSLEDLDSGNPPAKKKLTTNHEEYSSSTTLKNQGLFADRTKKRKKSSDDSNPHSLPQKKKSRLEDKNYSKPTLLDDQSIFSSSNPKTKKGKKSPDLQSFNHSTKKKK